MKTIYTFDGQKRETIVIDEADLEIKRALLASVRTGDKVTALFPAGQSSRRGKVVQEWVPRTGTANGLLIFQDHVVINLGGRYGTPGVVDASNIVRVKRAA